MGKNWANKVHKELNEDAEFNRVMQSKRMKDEMNKTYKAIAFQSTCLISFLGCEFLEQRYNANKEVFEDWLKFANARLCEIGNDPEYFEAVVKYYKEEHGLDIAETLGVDIGL